jgi:hypothetical protein
MARGVLRRLVSVETLAAHDNLWGRLQPGIGRYNRRILFVRNTVFPDKSGPIGFCEPSEAQIKKARIVRYGPFSQEEKSIT